MALGDFVKRTYVNNAVPAINATNLNKNETKIKELDTVVSGLDLTVSGLVVDKINQVDTIEDLRATTQSGLVFPKGYYSSGDECLYPRQYYDTGISGTYQENYDTIILPDGGDGSAAWIYERPISEVSQLIEQATTLKRKRPRCGDQIMNTLRNKEAQREQYVSPYSLGYTTSGLVVGTYYAENGTAVIGGGIFIGAPFDTSGTYSATLNLGLLGSSTYSNVIVQLSIYNAGAGGTSISDTAITGTSGIYTASTSAVASGQVVGWKILPQVGSGILDFNVVSFSITTPSAKVYTHTSSSIFTQCPISFLSSTGTGGTRYRLYSDGLESRSVGVKTGLLPTVLYTSPTATSDTTTGSVFINNDKGYSPELTTYPGRVFGKMKTYVQNGYPAPAMIMIPGTYASTSSNPIIYAGDIPSTFPNEYYLGCIYGQATLTAASGYSSSGVSILSTATTLPYINIANVVCDSSITTPFTISGVNSNLYRCTSNYSSVDGFSMRNCGDIILEDCYATGSVNDGFNAHGYGHISLVNCSAILNTDDGFSPHDFWTYEVWGGVYATNGKGNVTPAYGAQGFCIGVTSSGVTGLSPRVGELNYGGFLLTSDDRDRPSSMVLIDCTTSGDKAGVTCIGKRSVASIIDCNIYDAVSYSVMSNTTGDDYEPGIIRSLNTTISGETDINIIDRRKYLVYYMTNFSSP